MADVLTAVEFDAYTSRNIREVITRTLTIVKPSVITHDATDDVRSWGKLKTAVYNRHIKDRGPFVIPAISVLLDNSRSMYDLGGVVFPGGRGDLVNYTVRLVVTISGRVVVDFTGRPLEPEIDDTDHITLVIEHPLGVAASRKWVRDDRIGGDTGVDGMFV